MAKVISTNYQTLDTVDLRTRNPIKAINWRNIVEGQNNLFSSHGAHLSGIHLEDTFGQPFTYQGTGFTTESDNGLSLDVWTPQHRFIRETAGGFWRVMIKAFGKNFKLNVVARNSDGDTESVNVIETSTGWSETLFSFNENFINPTGTEISPISFRCSVKPDSGTSLKLYSINLYTAPLKPYQLP